MYILLCFQIKGHFFLSRVFVTQKAHALVSSWPLEESHSFSQSPPMRTLMQHQSGSPTYLIWGDLNTGKHIYHLCDIKYTSGQLSARCREKACAAWECVPMSSPSTRMSPPFSESWRRDFRLRKELGLLSHQGRCAKTRKRMLHGFLKKKKHPQKQPPLFL